MVVRHRASVGRFWTVLFAGLVGLCAAGLRADPALPAPAQKSIHLVTPEQVERLKKDLIAFLYKARSPNGTWEGSSYLRTEDAGGDTALAVYALLAAGESPQDARLKPAIEFVKRFHVTGTYVTGVRINACSYLPFASVKEVVKTDQQFLIDAQIPATAASTGSPARGAGLYGYTKTPPPDRVDHSVSQYGVLGMWITEQMGLAAPKEYWRTVEAAWLRDQNSDGGWSYDNTGPSTGSMTAAGVATLFITQDYVRMNAGVLQQNYVNEPLDRGLAWLAAHYRADQNPSADGSAAGYPFYWLYGVERVGIAGGIKYLGEHNWYDEGIRAIAAHDKKTGFSPNAASETPVQTAAFSLLFLVRGQKPVLINKLRYDGDWNHRPRDAANITRWYAKRFETELLWQVVRLDDNPRDFHDAPVLYLSGVGGLHWSDEQKQKLKTYIEDGGFLLINAQEHDTSIANSAQKLLEEMFPQYKARPLADDHLIMSGAYKLRKPFRAIGISNGIRELAVILPERDFPKSWQSAQEKQDPDAFNAAANILFYASDRNRLRVRGESNIVLRDPEIKAHQQAALARIKYDGNWDPEPGGWRRMQAILHNQNQIDLAVETIPLESLNLEGYQFAHITGLTPVKLSQDNLAELRRFIIGGGTLLVDAANGSQAFLSSIQGDLEQLIPNLRMAPIAVDDPILADTHPLPDPIPHIFPDDPVVKPTRPTEDHKLEVEYRRFAKANSKEAKGLVLKGVRAGRRYAIVVSPFDLSAGLVGQNIDGVMGYTPATATELVRRIIVNTLPQRN